MTIYSFVSKIKPMRTIGVQLLSDFIINISRKPSNEEREEEEEEEEEGEGGEGGSEPHLGGATWRARPAP